MPNKDYQDYIDLLRTREARPDFDRVAEIVSNGRSSKAGVALITKYAMILSSIALIGAAVWIFGPKSEDSPKTTMRVTVNENSKNSNITSEHHVSVAKVLVPEKSHATAARKNSNLENSSSEDYTLGSTANTIASESKETTTDSANTQPIHLCNAIMPVKVQPSLAADSHAETPIPFGDINGESEQFFFATLGGALAEQLSSNAAYTHFSYSDAFLGFGYNLSSNSSFRLLAGESVFELSSTHNALSFHDTTFTHNGEQYNNIIGQVATSTSVDPHRVYFTGISYRYSLGSPLSIRPIAEIFAGGSTYGLLTHGGIGVDIPLASHLQLDGLLTVSALLPQSQTWLTKSSLELATAYRW